AAIWEQSIPVEVIWATAGAGLRTHATSISIGSAMYHGILLVLIFTLSGYCFSWAEILGCVVATGFCGGGAKYCSSIQMPAFFFTSANSSFNFCACNFFSICEDTSFKSFRPRLTP